MKAHAWHFLAVAEGDLTSPTVIVVCEQCGVIRTANVSDGARIELSGECPAAPPTPDRRVYGLPSRR
jgi:hypothetical protein